MILTYMVGFNMVASYNLMDAFSGYSFFSPTTTPTVVGVVLAVLTALCIMGGSQRLSRVTGVLVPVMGGIYVLAALVMIVLHIGLLPGVIAAIFRNAFDFKAIFGGFTGSAMMHGIKRGLFSNEAGVGSAPNAAAAASVSHPVKQGLAQMLSVFLDTLVICSATAFLCLCSGVAPSPELKGVPYVQAALGATFGPAGNWFITVMTLFFAFTTILGNYYYCESNLHYILSREARKMELLVFRIIAVLIVFQGARLNFSLVWDTADVTMGFMGPYQPALYRAAGKARAAGASGLHPPAPGGEGPGVSCGGYRPRRQNGLLELEKAAGGVKTLPAAFRFFGQNSREFAEKQRPGRFSVSGALPGSYIIYFAGAVSVRFSHRATAKSTAQTAAPSTKTHCGPDSFHTAPNRPETVTARMWSMLRPKDRFSMTSAGDSLRERMSMVCTALKWSVMKMRI